MDSYELKTKVLHYWRFKRNYFFIATEAGKFRSDVLASNGEEIVEIEIKRSLQDLKKEFEKKKHKIYQEPSKWYSQWVPNRFYLAVPQELGNAALELGKEWGYGVIIVKDNPLTMHKRANFCEIIKRPKIIQPKFKEKLHNQIVRRATSELIRIRLANQKN